MLGSTCYSGLKKWTSIPCVTMFHIAPKTSRILRIIPRIPSDKLRYHNMVYLFCLWIIIHIKQGYAKVTGNAIPPINPAKLGKNGRATDMKKARHPKNIRIKTLSHQGQGLLLLLVYFNSRLSNTGIAYIWNEVRLLSTTKRLANPRIAFAVSFLWYCCNALRIPPFLGIWQWKRESSLVYVIRIICNIFCIIFFDGRC